MTRTILAACLAACLAAAMGSAGAQAYPNRPIKFVVPFPPGGGLDVTARTVQPRLQELLGQPLVIDNRAGAGGIVGAAYAKSQPADGYTILLGNTGTLGLYPATHDKLPYDAVRDFAPVGQLITNTLVAAVNESVPARNLQELVAWAKANPGRMSYASGGNGAITHLAGELLKARTGIDMLHVPYKGSAPAVSDLLGGQVHLLIDVLAVFHSHIKAGKLRAIGVTSLKRLPALPDVPTFDEQGLAGYEATGWQGIVVPAGTPPDVVARLADALQKAMADSAVRERFVAQGAEPTPSGPDAFGRHIRSEIEKWTRIARAANVRVD